MAGGRIWAPSHCSYMSKLVSSAGAQTKCQGYVTEEDESQRSFESSRGSASLLAADARCKGFFSWSAITEGWEEMIAAGLVTSVKAFRARRYL